MASVLDRLGAYLLRKQGAKIREAAKVSKTPNKKATKKQQRINKFRKDAFTEFREEKAKRKKEEAEFLRKSRERFKSKKKK